MRTYRDRVMRAKTLFAGAVFILAFASGPSLAAAAPPAKKAEPAPAGPSAEAKEQARSAYGRGQAAFNAGQYADAKTAFQAAFAAVPNPIVLLSIAEAQVKLDELADGIATFQQYLELRPDAPDRADIEAKIKALSATPAHLIVTTDPAGAEIDLDGLPTQKKTPTQFELTPGDHTIEYSLHGFQGGSEHVLAKPGAAPELHLTLKATPPPALVASAAAPVAAPVSSSDVDGPAEPGMAGPPTTALWVTASVGAAGLVAGSVLGFLSLKEHSNYTDHPTTASANRGERLALFADVGFGVAVMAAATCAVLYFTSDDAPTADPHAADGGKGARAKLEILPALSPTSAAASARLTF